MSQIQYILQYRSYSIVIHHCKQDNMLLNSGFVRMKKCTRLLKPQLVYNENSQTGRDDREHMLMHSWQLDVRWSGLQPGTGGPVEHRASYKFLQKMAKNITVSFFNLAQKVRGNSLTSCDMRSMSSNNTFRISTKYEATSVCRLWVVRQEAIFPTTVTLMYVSSMLLSWQYPSPSPSGSSHTPENITRAISAELLLEHEPVCKHLYTSVSWSRRSFEVQRSMMMLTVLHGPALWCTRK